MGVPSATDTFVTRQEWDQPSFPAEKDGSPRKRIEANA